MLKGSKIILRPVKRSDISDFLVWFNDPDVIQYLELYRPMTEMDEEKWIEGLAGDNTRVNFVIEAIQPTRNKPIGTIGFQNLDNHDRRCEFGIAIGVKDYWSHGYGTEAAHLVLKYGFEQLNMHRIASHVFAFNQRSQRLHLKIGFKQEGVRRESRFINGAYQDVIEYGILSEEWRRLNDQVKNAGD